MKKRTFCIVSLTLMVHSLFGTAPKCNNQPITEPTSGSNFTDGSLFTLPGSSSRKACQTNPILLPKTSPQKCAPKRILPPPSNIKTSVNNLPNKSPPPPRGELTIVVPRPEPQKVTPPQNKNNFTKTPMLSDTYQKYNGNYSCVSPQITYDYTVYPDNSGTYSSVVPRSPQGPIMSDTYQRYSGNCPCASPQTSYDYTVYPDNSGTYSSYDGSGYSYPYSTYPNTSMEYYPNSPYSSASYVNPNSYAYPDPSYEYYLRNGGYPPPQVNYNQYPYSFNPPMSAPYPPGARPSEQPYPPPGGAPFPSNQPYPPWFRPGEQPYPPSGSAPYPNGQPYPLGARPGEQPYPPPGGAPFPNDPSLPPPPEMIYAPFPEPPKPKDGGVCPPCMGPSRFPPPCVSGAYRRCAGNWGCGNGYGYGPYGGGCGGYGGCGSGCGGCCGGPGDPCLPAPGCYPSAPARGTTCSLTIASMLIPVLLIAGIAAIILSSGEGKHGHPRPKNQ